MMKDYGDIVSDYTDISTIAKGTVEDFNVKRKLLS
jgi:hypothetical protein